MKKREFAVRLLFWLFPWPISKALPRSLRIYYWGPTAGPPPGWYDYYGIPKWFWPDVPPYEDLIEDPPDEPPAWYPPVVPPWDDFIEDPPDEPPAWYPPVVPPYDDFIEDPPVKPPPWWDPSWPPYEEFIEDLPDKPPPWYPPVVPPWDDFIEDPPDEPPAWYPPVVPPWDDFIEDPPVEPPPWFPVDPYDPPPPDQFPDPGPGPINPGDPYVPGPGPNVPFHGNLYFPFFDNTFWAAAGGISWNAALKRWTGNGVDVTLSAIGTWANDFRASWIYFDWTGTDIYWIHLNDTDGNIIATVNNPGNKVYINIAFEGYDIDTITLDGDTIQIKDIHFV